MATALAVPLVLAGGTAAYAVHYQDRALPRTSVVGIDIGGMTRTEVADALRARVDAAVIEVTASGSTHDASLKDLGYAVDIDATVEQIFDLNSTWTSYARAPFNDDTVEIVTTHDSEALSAYVAKTLADDVRVAANASVARAEDQLSYVVTPAVTGQAADPRELAEVAAQVATTLTPGSATIELIESAPAVSTDAATRVADQANAMITREVVVTVGERNVSPPDAEQATWVSITDTGSADELGEPVVDEAKIAAWLSSAIDIAPRKGLRYVTSTGKLLRVATQARDGRKLTDPDALAKQVATTLASGAVSITAPVTTMPATWNERRVAPGAENLAYPAVEGEKWIDVNLSRHTMTAYVGGKAVFGPVATVDGARATPTDVGTFKVYVKRANMTMRGNNVDGTRYSTPNVPWSLFFNRGEALHGAYWRSEFGYSASHGCVNLPVKTAKWVYDWAPIGTVVKTHH